MFYRKLRLMVPLHWEELPRLCPRRPFLGMRIQLDLKTACIPLCVPSLFCAVTVVGPKKYPRVVPFSYRGWAGAIMSHIQDLTCHFAVRINIPCSPACGSAYHCLQQPGMVSPCRAQSVIFCDYIRDLGLQCSLECNCLGVHCLGQAWSLCVIITKPLLLQQSVCQSIL